MPPSLSTRESRPGLKCGNERMQLYYVVNSGVYMRSGETALLIDGIHRGELVGFSQMPPGQAKLFPVAPERFLFTHDHLDHFDERILSLEGMLPCIYGPGFGKAPRSGDQTGLVQLLSGETKVFAMATEHAGKGFSAEPHCSYCISMDGTWIFVAGDARLNEKTGQQLRELSFQSFDVAIMGPMQLLDKDGVQFLKKAAVKQVFIYHLPFRSDDCMGCYTLAKEAVRRFPDELPPPIVLTPMSWISLTQGQVVGMSGQQR